MPFNLPIPEHEGKGCWEVFMIGGLDCSTAPTVLVYGMQAPTQELHYEQAERPHWSSAVFSFVNNEMLHVHPSGQAYLQHVTLIMIKMQCHDQKSMIRMPHLPKAGFRRGSSVSGRLCHALLATHNSFQGPRSRAVAHLRRSSCCGYSHSCGASWTIGGMTCCRSASRGGPCVR